MLENRAYCGDLEQGKEESASAISKIRIKHEHGIIVENTHEPIISREMFFEVQNLIASRKVGPRPTPKKHLFTDILICGECGKNYWYRSSVVHTQDMERRLVTCMQLRRKKLRELSLRS